MLAPAAVLARVVLVVGAAMGVIVAFAVVVFALDLVERVFSAMLVGNLSMTVVVEAKRVASRNIDGHVIGTRYESL